MTYKFRVGNDTISEVLKEIDRLGQSEDLSKSLEDAKAGVSVDQNGRLVRQDADLQGFAATSDTEIDSITLSRLQTLIKNKGLGKKSKLLRKVVRANPPECNPPYDCGNTYLT